MKTSLNEIERIEKWLFKQGGFQDRLLTEAKILMNPALKEKVQWQSESYGLIQQYGQEKFYKEIRTVEDELFNSSKHQLFQNRIKSIFNL